MLPELIGELAHVIATIGAQRGAGWQVCIHQHQDAVTLAGAHDAPNIAPISRPGEFSIKALAR